MNFSIQKVENHYFLEMNYTVSQTPDAVWQWLATTEGFKKWFPQLQIEVTEPDTLPLLVFVMENFRQEMKLLSYEAPHNIKYQWGQATVSFSIQAMHLETLVTFREEIPMDYQG